MAVDVMAGMMLVAVPLNELFLVCEMCGQIELILVLKPRVRSKKGWPLGWGKTACGFQLC